MTVSNAVPSSERAAVHATRIVPLVLLVNTVGSMFGLLRLSSEVNQSTGSGLLSGAVLTAPWLAALVLVKLLNRILAERRPSRLIQLAEATSLALTLALAVLPIQGAVLIAVAVAVLLVRGFFEAVTRSATSVLLRILVPAEGLNQANTLAEIGKLAGVSAGAALAGLLSSVLSLQAYFSVNAVTLACSLLLASILPASAPPSKDVEDVRRPASAVTRILLDNAVLRRLFALFLLVAFWQGFHTVAVNVIPRGLLGGGTSLVGVFFALSAVAIFAGSFVALPVQRYLGRLPIETWTTVPMLPLLAAVLLARTVPTLASYAIFLVLFEVAYVVCNNRLLALARPEEVAAVVTLRATMLPLGVVVSILAIGLVSDLTSPVVAMLTVVVVTGAVTASSRLGSSQRVNVRSGG